MGRKSSAKKKRKIPQQKHEQKHERKIEKKIAQIITKPETPVSKPKTPIHPQKIFGSLLALIMATLLIVVGVNLFEKNFRPTPIAEIVPADKTSAILEINTYADHTQITKAARILDSTDYSQQKIKDMINEKLKIAVEFDIAPWLGRQVGAAEIEVDPKKDLSTVFFLETTDQAKALEFLTKTAKDNLTDLKEAKEGNREIYSWVLRDAGADRAKDQPIFAVFMNEYLIISLDQDAIKLLVNSGDSAKVSKTDEYGEIESKMPFNKIGFLFVNYDVAYDKLLQKYNSISGLPLYTLARSPFKKLTKREGAALIAKENNFEIESFILFKDTYLKGTDALSNTKKYNANLLELLPDDVSFLWGGEEVKSQIGRMVSLLSEGSSDTNTMFEGVIKNYIEKYFGTNISLEEDIYPLLENEFLIAMTKQGNKDIYTFLVELGDPLDGALAIQKIAENFASVGAVFEPRVQETTLPDGTKAKEIVATPQDLIKSESAYKDVVVYEMATKDQSWGLFYAIYDEEVIISTNKEALIKSLKLALGEGTNSIKNSIKFQSIIQPVLAISDSAIYVDVKSLFPETKLIKEIGMAQNYYANGFLADYILHVE